MKTVGICSIATNGYDKYLIDCIESYSNMRNTEFLTNWYIFSDVADELRGKIANSKEIHFHFFQIKSYGWPEATLLRYQIYADHLESLNDDYLMHLDADMLFTSNFVFPNLDIDSNTMFFVLHPGFANTRLGFRNPLKEIKKLLRLLMIGGHGAWETRKISNAYVPRKLRRVYFCGGIWFGKKMEFSDFVSKQSVSVADDLANNIIAKWHDESHLNRYAAYNKVMILGPQYCYDGKVELSSKKPLVIAVEK